MQNEFLMQLDFDHLLTEDLRRIFEIVGREKFIELYNEFAKQTIYFSTKPLAACKKQFIRQNKDMSVKKLAKHLGVSEMFVYNYLNDELR